MATPAETILHRPRPDIIRGIRRPVEVTDEQAVIEAARLTLISHGLLSQTQTIEALPQDSKLRRHELSKGKYIVEYEIGDNIVYVYTLEAGEETSSHYHHRRSSEERPDMGESIVCVQGQAIVTIESEQRVLQEGQAAKILPHNWHSVKAITGSVLAAFSENAVKYPRHERHVGRR